MRRQLNHQGFTVLEAIASVFIISLVLTTAISIVINVRNQTEATNERILAVEVGSRIRDDLINNSTYDEISVWMNGGGVLVTSSTCASLATPFSCDIFTYTSNNRVYDETMTLSFIAPTVESTQYQVIHFEIIIEYYPHRFLTLEGIIYE
ncbi:MAG: hypothetical protein KKG64_03860 [Firmicutes bacterium]|nr:hypothetical protein [Bacillota bacterium]